MKKIYLMIIFNLFLFELSAQSLPHWNTVSSGTTKDLYSISFANPQTGFIGGQGGLLLKTMDSGHTWQLLNQNIGAGSNQLFSDVVDLQFLDSLHGYAILSKYPSNQYQGLLFQTTDGGQTWAPANDSVTIAASRCYFFEWGNGFLLGSAFFAGNVIAKMQQGLWTEYANFNYNPSAFLYGIDFKDRLTGIIGGGGGNFYRTFDGGQSWDTVYSGYDSTIYSIRYLNDSVIVAATGHGNRSVIISYNKGATWQDEVNSFTFAYPIMQSITIGAGDSIISVGYTTDPGMNGGSVYWFDGISWQEQSFYSALYDVAKQSNKVAYAVGDSGLIITNSSSPNTFVAYIEKRNDKIRVFPNPSNRRIYLQYTGLKIKSLLLLELSGRLIKNFAPESRSLDLTNIPSGVYLLQAKVLEGIITKKIRINAE